MEYTEEQLNALCTAIKEYYTPSHEDDEDYYDDEDPTFTFRVRGVLVDFGSVINYDGVYQLREGGSYSDGRTFSGKSIKRLARNILADNCD
jgi:hypothetical protein